MNWHKVTRIFVLVTILIISIYDIFAIAGGGTSASISHLLIVWSYEYPVFTFAMGFTMGHLFWRVRQTKELEEMGK